MLNARTLVEARARRVSDQRRARRPSGRRGPADALASGQIAGATLDVFRDEPLPADHPFWQAPRITITPHMSALTLREESVEQVARQNRSTQAGRDSRRRGESRTRILMA